MNASTKSLMAAIAVLMVGLQTTGCAPSLKITKPVANSTVRSPVEICMEVRQYIVEPAKKGVNPGAGHHHLLVDIPVPEDMDAPIGKGEGHIHMGDGSHCKNVKLQPGFHTIQSIFADGNHVPVKPPLTTAISVVVKE